MILFFFIYIKPSIISAMCLHVYQYLTFEAILLLLTVASDLMSVPKTAMVSFFVNLVSCFETPRLAFPEIMWRSDVFVSSCLHITLFISVTLVSLNCGKMCY